MQISNEFFFLGIAVIIVVTTIWFLRSASAYKAWVKTREEQERSP